MNADTRDIVERLRGEMNIAVKYSPDRQDTIATLRDAADEIELLRGVRDEWVNHGLDDIDRMDMDGLRLVLTRLTDRIDELIADREHEPSVTAYGLGYAAGARSVEAVSS